MHSVIATLKFILENSITFNINDVTLNKELIDLGLPKCIFSIILKKTYKVSLKLTNQIKINFYPRQIKMF